MFETQTCNRAETKQSLPNTLTDEENLNSDARKKELPSPLEMDGVRVGFARVFELDFGICRPGPNLGCLFQFPVRMKPFRFMLCISIILTCMCCLFEVSIIASPLCNHIYVYSDARRSKEGLAIHQHDILFGMTYTFSRVEELSNREPLLTK